MYNLATWLASCCFSLSSNNSVRAMRHSGEYFLLSASQRIRAGVAIRYPTLAAKQGNSIKKTKTTTHYSLILLMTKGTPSWCDNHEIISFRGLEDPRGVISSGWPSPLSLINSETNICIPVLHFSGSRFHLRNISFFLFKYLHFCCSKK